MAIQRFLEPVPLVLVQGHCRQDIEWITGDMAAIFSLNLQSRITISSFIYVA